jgi:hypothetical protein
VGNISATTHCDDPPWLGILAIGRVKRKPVGLCLPQSPPLMLHRQETILANPRNDGELLNDANLYGVCTFCGTPRITNADRRANVGTQAVICANEECPAMQAILVEPTESS